MKKSASVSLLIVLLVAQAAGAAGGGKESGVAQWIKSMQRKIEGIMPKKSVNMSTGVAGVRGAKEAPQAKLYWKGARDAEPVGEEELRTFKAAIDLAAGGESVAAQVELETFMSQYPDSALIPDAKKTLDIVKAELLKDEKADAEKKPGMAN